MATRRTLDREEAARRRYKETGRSLENGGCIGDPPIVVDRCMVFLCMLHCCMAIGRLHVANWPCARMSLRASTPSLSAHTMTTRAGGGGGGMPGATQVEREGEVVSQVWEWWFLKFELPLHNYGTPHGAPCTMAKLMATHSPPPSTLASPPLALFSPYHGRLGHAKDVGRHARSEQRSPGVFCLCMLACVYELIFPSICLIFRDKWGAQKLIFFNFFFILSLS